MEKPNIPLQNAVALAYNASQAAPQVVAKGRGLVAEAIIARAREAGVYVHESKELVSLLMQVELDQQIPPALYRTVAELLAWLYRIENMQLTETVMYDTRLNNSNNSSGESDPTR
ncbi:flagellar biosynthesis protein [Herbaspirillum rubrisubalbicans]|jgi:flagellar biosynthesis protein|uniref:Flagellar biosynthesis protein n=2 Tax=Herbaspirillum rubrisubalbicans TaxID=80842 RepID=A0AAD0UAM3_9BURK|nr:MULTISPECIES: EscU/YscU/HrcU family type III secretion system export apparatus switch protein [Herbaspirillum]ALU89139.1 flagellar biosynthetic protein [Herbaspirillum rubrisubalbicans M1]AYR24160.1 flagellar biosynthesis protein [Herbaspirillum rubrisubalbicans]MCP1572108.1 flagellar biosynthesis protein [Herbaspirillum rubrisubalbicans]NQE48574.1 flagellar biosynthesis protein [Herbaspirillum rubrisubalbicans]QJQ00751.1 flagellar biosynthesis protein [Herbaspirillum rubrisubalbicans Os34]